MAAANWQDVLGEFDVRTFAPRDVTASFGHATPEDALAASGVPGDGRLLVLVNDPDRATSTPEALAALRRACGSRPFELLIATGSHRFDEGVRVRHERALLAAAGRLAGEPASVRWHDARGGRHLPCDGVDGPRVDAALVEADAVVAIGSVEPHWFAGLTGAYKTLSVGVLAIADIESNHRHALEPRSRPLALAGNPVHEGLAAVADAVSRGREVIALQHLGPRWIAGDAVAIAHMSLPAAQARWRHDVGAPLDFVVARVEPPLDRCLYQAEKGVKQTEHAVRDGGAIVLDAACPDGVGPARFVEFMTAVADAPSARRRIACEGYHLGDHKGVRLRDLTGRGVRLGLVAPTFPLDAAAAAGFTVLSDREHALRWLTEIVGPGARGVIAEDAGHTVLETKQLLDSTQLLGTTQT